MAARVSITGASIGTGESHRWRSIKSPPKVSPDETHVRIWLGISNVRGDRETVVKAIDELISQGEIKQCHLSTLGSTAGIICVPGTDVVRAMHKSGTVDNEFVVGLQNKLRELLDKIGAKK